MILCIPPKGEYTVFQDEEHYAQKVREWGLSSAKAVKREFVYKTKEAAETVTIKGYETYGVTGSFDTVVVAFPDGREGCVHPDYLKDMQTSTFAKAEKTETVESKPAPKPAPKQILPTEKVSFTGTVKQFAASWNHFAEANEEVVIFEEVLILGEEKREIGTAWCSHSKTLKKQELKAGQVLQFDGKIVKKSLPKGKDAEDEALVFEGQAPYKINNPSKIKVQNTLS